MISFSQSEGCWDEAQPVRCNQLMHNQHQSWTQPAFTRTSAVSFPEPIGYEPFQSNRLQQGGFELQPPRSDRNCCWKAAANVLKKIQDCGNILEASGATCADSTSALHQRLNICQDISDVNLCFAQQPGNIPFRKFLHNYPAENAWEDWNLDF